MTTTTTTTTLVSPSLSTYGFLSGICACFFSSILHGLFACLIAMQKIVICLFPCRDVQVILQHAKKIHTQLKATILKNHAEERYISIYFPSINSDTNELLKEFFTVSFLSLFFFVSSTTLLSFPLPLPAFHSFAFQLELLLLHVVCVVVVFFPFGEYISAFIVQTVLFCPACLRVCLSFQE